MSGQDIQNQDLNAIAQQAEGQLNSHEAKAGHIGLDRQGRHDKPASSSITESGVNEDVEKRFDGAQVTYGSAASGAGNNREIPDEEGGGINPATGRQTKAGDFEGVGGPEEKMAAAEQERPGDDDIHGNVRQAGTTAGTTRRPDPTGGSNAA